MTQEIQSFEKVTSILFKKYLNLDSKSKENVARSYEEVIENRAKQAIFWDKLRPPLDLDNPNNKHFQLSYMVSIFRRGITENVFQLPEDMQSEIGKKMRDLNFQKQILDVKNTCFYCITTIETNKKCGKCKMVKYCSKECQTLDWNETHKETCAIICDSFGYLFE